MKLNQTQLDFIKNGLDREIMQCENNAKEIIDREGNEDFNSISVQFTLINMIKSLKREIEQLESESTKKEYILRTVDSFSRK